MRAPRGNPRAGSGPGHWNDPDLLEVGNGGMAAGEYRSQFAIWALMKAPLLLSTDVASLSPPTLALLSNPELIALNQDRLGVAGRIVEERPPDPAHLQVWAGPLSGGRVALVLWNRGEVAAPILARFVNLQLFSPKAAARDCLARTELGVFSGQVERNVSAHDVAVMVLTPAGEDGAPLDSTAAAAAMDDRAWAERWRGHGIRVPLSRRLWEQHSPSATTPPRRPRYPTS